MKSARQPEKARPASATEDFAALENEALSMVLQGVLICDEERRVLYANAAFTRITGYREDEILGKTCRFLQGKATNPATLDALRSAMRSGQSFEGEILNYRKDGTTFWNELSISAIPDAHGRTVRFIGLQRDITERKQREAERDELSEKLLAETKRLQESQAVAGVGSWQTNLSTLAVTWTDETFRIFESQPGLFTPTHEKFLSFVHPDDRPQVENAFARSIGQPGPFSVEHRLLFPDGRIKFVEERWQTFLNAANQPTHAVGTCQDITERKIAQAATEQVLQRLTEAQRIGQIGDWDWDLARQEIIWSPQIYEILGRDPALGPPSDLEEHLEPHGEAGSSFFQKIAEQAITTGVPQNHEIALVRPDGHPVYVQARAVPRKDATGKVCGISGTVQDITRHRLAEAALRESEERFAAFMLNAPIAAWIVDEESRFVYVNQGYADFHGRPAAELLGKHLNELFNEEFVAQYQANNQRVLQSGEALETVETALLHDGSLGHFLSLKFPITASHGSRLVGGAAVDITELKRAELEISRINRALKMLSACNEALIRTDNEPDLLKQICLIAVEHGGYRMAWAGYAHNDDARSIQPLAHAGFEQGYLTEVPMSWSDDQPQGRGPAGRVIRSGQILVCADLATEPDFAPWRDNALSRGYRSLIDLPLRSDARTFGLLGLYASEARVPAAEEMKLLKELADNLAFGIGSLRSREESRRMQEAQMLAARRTELAARASGVGIWELDLVEDVLHWDDQMYVLYGVDPESGPAGVKFWEQHLHPDDWDRMQAEVAEALRPNGRPFDTQFRIIRQGSDAVRHVRAQAIVVSNEQNHPVRMLGTNWDVTVEVEREQALQEKLRNEENLRRQALAGEKAKSEFLAVMSHEVRTPMNGILGFAEVLAHSSSLSPEDRDLSQTIVSSGEALLRILNDILDFSRIEAGRLEIERQVFSPRELIEGVRQLFARQIHAKGLELEGDIEADIPGAVEGDPGRIRQILVNLVGNALKFTERGSIHIQLGLSGDPAADRALEFVVRDTGPGIAPERARAVFEAFTQADSSISRRHGGTGLGLTIARRLAKLMDGSLQMRSQPGEGTTFTLRIPLLLPPPAGTPPSSDPLPPSQMGVEFASAHPLRILLAEDDSVNRKLMTVILRRLGYEPLTARNGLEALAAYTKEKPDCIFMDLQMPEMDGMDATRNIRELEANRAVRPAFISALTANILPEDQQRCFRIGMNAFLNKPVKSQAIAAVLDQAWQFRHPAN